MTEDSVDEEEDVEETEEEAEDVAEVEAAEDEAEVDLEAEIETREPGTQLPDSVDWSKLARSRVWMTSSLTPGPSKKSKLSTNLPTAERNSERKP